MYADKQKHLSTDDSYARVRAVENRVQLVLVGLVAAAILLAVCARLVPRRWPPVHLFAVAVEALAVAIIVLEVGIGLGATLLMVLYAVLTAWILVDLFRGEVLRYLWRVGP